MRTRSALLPAAALFLGACASDRAAITATSDVHIREAEPLVIGETFTIDSSIMGETRRVNVMTPTVYGRTFDEPLPVLYVLDGGVNEDFTHIAGLVQVLVSNGSMRPFMLVGLENTQRRRDMTGATTSEEDRKIAPVVGGAAAFRRFIEEELMPAVAARYRITDEAAIIGESLAGLFVIESFFLTPHLFDTYIAIDPSLWWNGEELLNWADARLRSAPLAGRTLFVASSNEPELAASASKLAAIINSRRVAGFTFKFAPMSEETHATIYHPAAMRALRAVCAEGTQTN